EYLLAFKEKLENISNVLEIPPLNPESLNDQIIAKIVSETSHKQHPVSFTDVELEIMIRKRFRAS
nr:hypothetical protein [Bacteroidales bacterium]